MAEINLNLRKPKSESETPINVIIRYGGQKLVYSSGRKVQPKYWDITNQKVRKTKDYQNADIINANLRQITEDIFSEMERYQKDNNQNLPEPSELKHIMDLKYGRVTIVRKQNFFEFIEWFSYEYAPKKQIVTMNETSPTSINTLKTYTTTLRLLKVFAKDYGNFDFPEINMDWYFKFTDWCNAVKNYNPSTIGKHIKVIKLWLRKAEEEGISVTTFYKHRDFRKPAYISEAIYLNREELSLIHSLDLNLRIELDRIRDLFLIGCWTGLRFSDFNKLQGKHICEEFIRIKTDKTNSYAVIPINKIVKQILLKYNNMVPNGYTNQYMNRQLKVICKMAGINSPETKVEFKNGKKNVIHVLKWELVSTHTARRSFATNLYGLVPNNTIMAITTHKTESAFLRYLRKSNDEHAHILKKVMDIG